VFKQYVTTDGKTYERWLSPEAYHAYCVDRTFWHARKRAKDNNLPCNINTEYLLSIYPGDGLCPALHIPLMWGGEGGRSNSPSLDKKVPALGYVRGNVAFISNKANQIKSNATTEEVLAVAKYLQG
jgi:hypothetical protein